MERTKTFYKRLFYSEETFRILDFLTLRIANKEIQQQYYWTLGLNFDRFFTPLLTLSIFFLIEQLLIYFIVSDSPFPRLITAIAYFILMLVWALIRLKYRSQAPLILFFAILVQCLYVNLQFCNIMPGILAEPDISEIENSILLILFISNCINCNPFMQTTIFIPTVSLVSSYFQYTN